jgi:RAB protein geranylgeranyltransferase component A
MPDYSNPASHIDPVYEKTNTVSENKKVDETSPHNSLSDDVTQIYPDKPLEH